MKKKSTSKLVTDPVCKMEVPVSEAAASLKFNGQTYYFCHVVCQRLFEADPLAYIAETNQAEGATSAAGPEHTRRHA